MYNPLRSKKIIPWNELNFGWLRNPWLLRQEPRKNLIKRDMPLDGNFFDKKLSWLELDWSKTIVIEFKMKVAWASNDLDFLLVYDNWLTTWDLIYLWTTTYAGRWMWLYGWGVFWNVIATSWSSPTVWTYYEYRLTVNGTSIQWQRWPTLASITHTINQTMSVSAAWKKLYPMFASWGSSYPGWYFDWIKIYENWVLVFFDDFDWTAIKDEIWEYQAVATFPWDSSLWVWVTSWGWNVRSQAINPSNVTYWDRDCSYNSKMALFNWTSTVITDVSKNANCRSISDTQKWTISFAYKPTANSWANALIAQSYSWWAWWWAIKTSAEKLNFATANSWWATYKTTTSSVSLVQNAIHHIILEWDWTTLTQYVNLQSVSETKSWSTTKTDTLQFWWTWAYWYHTMELWKVKYFNHILSAKEKIELYNEVFKILH